MWKWKQWRLIFCECFFILKKEEETKKWKIIKDKDNQLFEKNCKWCTWWFWCIQNTLQKCELWKIKEHVKKNCMKEQWVSVKSCGFWLILWLGEIWLY